MRRATLSLIMAISLLAAGVGVAAAATPDKGCPGGGSGFQSYGLNPDWEHGDPIPAPGEDEWWDLTVAGILAEGETVESVAVLFGFATAEELYEAVLVGILGLDKNGDGAVCAKPYKEKHPLPAYFFNAVDNNARAH